MKTTYKKDKKVWNANYKKDDLSRFFYADFKCNRYIEVLKKFKKQSCSLLADQPDGTVELHSSNFIHNVSFVFIDNTRRQLLNLIDKWLRWERTATKQKDKFEKSIGSLDIATSRWKRKKENAWNSDLFITLNLTFFSQSTKYHQLVISSSKMEASHNKFITHDFDPLYLDKKEILLLRKSLTDQAITDAINKQVKNKVKEDKYQ